MFGAIVCDVIGSYYEHFPIKSTDFYLFRDESTFTDDTVLTIAVADWLLNDLDLIDTFHRYVHRYPDAGYGGSFITWAECRQREPYNSWGNGSAMRVSPIAYVVDSMDDLMSFAKDSASVTHNHPDGVRGAQATAACVYLARIGKSKADICDWITKNFDYDLSRTLAEIRPHYLFEVSCNGSVPESIIAFLESTDFESAVRNAVSLGGDADTMACIAGAIAEPFYGGVPFDLYHQTLALLDRRICKMVESFYERFVGHQPYAS